jgi:hypothetical protein
MASPSACRSHHPSYCYGHPFQAPCYLCTATSRIVCYVSSVRWFRFSHLLSAALRNSSRKFTSIKTKHAPEGLRFLTSSYHGPLNMDGGRRPLRCFEIRERCRPVWLRLVAPRVDKAPGTAYLLITSRQRRPV